MTERVIIAGFGGQGVMLIGKLLARVAMHEGKEVTFFPTYGTEVRGGTANCHVIVSDEEIFSPLIEKADSLIIMNQASYDKFKGNIHRRSTIFINSSMVEPDDSLNARTIEIPATEIAGSLGEVRVANMVMMGAYNSAKRIVGEETLLSELRASLKQKNPKLMEINERAFAEGKKILLQSGWAS